jgi:hypothetical protein
MSKVGSLVVFARGMVSVLIYGVEMGGNTSLFLEATCIALPGLVLGLRATTFVTIHAVICVFFTFECKCIRQVRCLID